MPGESAPPRPIDAGASSAAAGVDADAGPAAGAPPSGPDPAPATADPGTGPAAGAGRRSLLTDAAVVFGLAGVAVTQPVLDLFGANPTFFVAGRYGDGQIVAFALLVALVPGLAVLAATAPFAGLGRRAGALAHGLAVAALAGVFALAVCRTLGVDGLAAAVGAALAAAVVVAVVEARSALARRFLAYLAIGNLAFVVLFLVASPTAELLGAPPAADLGTVEVPPLEGPVVVVVLDELPVTALLRRTAASTTPATPTSAASPLRRPGSATPPAGRARPTCRCRACSPGSGRRTPRCPPTPTTPATSTRCSATGTRSPSTARWSRCAPPTCALGRAPARSARWWPTPRSSTATGCSRPACARGCRTSTRAGAASATRSACRHRPARAGAPTCSPLVDDLGLEELTASGQAAALARRTQQVGPEPSVNFVHVMLPHTPYRLTPWGPNADTWEPGQVPADPTGDQRSIYRDIVALQVGALDVQLGRMIDHLEAAGAWDDALVVVTSDHGIDASAPGFGREPDDGNLDELLRIPLFIKAPGQAAGAVSDEPASTIDVLPSIIDLLGIETDWEVEGHSLFDGSEPRVERELTTGFDAAVDIVAGRAEQFAGGDGWDALAGVGPARGLVGLPVSDHVVGDPSPLGWTVDRRDLLDDLSLDGEVPYLLRATVSGDAPVELVVALNGRIAGAVASHGMGGDGATPVSEVMAPYFRDGHNDVEAFQVSQQGDRVVLHPVREAG